MLNIHNLSVAFGGEYLFEEITFRLGAGDRVGLVGKNGAGKSTMLKLLSKEMQPDTGTIAAEKEIKTFGNDVPIGDRINMVFSGTIVTYGRGKFLVTATGNDTEIGQVAGLLESTTEQKTPLQRGLDSFSKKLSMAILVLSLVILGIQLLRVFLEGSADMTQDIVNAFMFAVAVAVAAIPEALQSIVTIVLSLGTKKMARQHAIIRKLPTVETLGSTSIICTDKTGTLTQNKMTVIDHFLADGQSGEFSNDPKHWEQLYCKQQ